MNQAANILVVDDDAAMGEMVGEQLVSAGFRAQAAKGGAHALELLAAQPWDAVITDLRMDGVDGFSVLERARQLAPQRPVLVMTAFGAISSAVEAIRRGAYHYLTKPFRFEELLIFLRRALEEGALRRDAQVLRENLRTRDGARDLEATPGLSGVFGVLRRVVDAQVPILLLGETGTGKSALAAWVHANGRRAERAFVSLNCAALPEHLLESELFGHVRGAFTGAAQDRRGLFQEAHGGTLLLDEIGEMPLPLQAKLLHALERGTVRPVGSNKDVEVDVRLVAATHRDVRQDVHEGRFRGDLLYRLDVISVTVPPLRQRPQDVPLLARRFLQEVLSRHPGARVNHIPPLAMEALVHHTWPGNVRELMHVMERAVLLEDQEGLAVPVFAGAGTQLAPAGALVFPQLVSMREMQREYAKWVLQQQGGNRTRAAAALDIDFKTLQKLLGGQ